MSIQFHVGQKVVCINAGHILARWLLGPAPELEEGRVYTVKGISHFGESLGVELQEVSPPDDDPDFEFCGFHSGRFRPVIERKTSIEIFQAMLITPKVGIPA
jgi:hypothetical protein